MSAFKKLFTDMINAGGDLDKLSKDMRKQMLKVFVKESHPHFLVSDSYFYVPAYFTPAAMNEFKDKFSNVSIADLREKIILISNWSLELRKVDSQTVFSSYAGLEVRLIVHSFRPQLQEQLHPVRYPTNLFRDDEFKTTIQSFRHSQVQDSYARQSTDLAPLHGKGNISQGIVSQKGDEWSFKEGNTKTVHLGTSRKAAASTSVVKSTGGASGKRASKAAAKAVKKPSTSKSKVVEKVVKYSPTKKATPLKGKKSATGATGKSLPTPSGKKSKGTTDRMTMATFKRFLEHHETKKGGKKSTTSLGKRSASGKTPTKGQKKSGKHYLVKRLE